MKRCSRRNELSCTVDSFSTAGSHSPSARRNRAEADCAFPNCGSESCSLTVGGCCDRDFTGSVICESAGSPFQDGCVTDSADGIVIPKIPDHRRFATVGDGDGSVGTPWLIFSSTETDSGGTFNLPNGSSPTSLTWSTISIQAEPAETLLNSIWVDGRRQRSIAARASGVGGKVP